MVPEDQSRPVEDVRGDTNVDSKEESVDRVDDQKSVQSDTGALLSSSIGVKGLQGVQPVGIDQDQIFSQVISGQRRLEPQQLLYGVRSGPQSQVIYQSINHQVPITVEEHRIVRPLVIRDMKIWVHWEVQSFCLHICWQVL